MTQVYLNNMVWHYFNTRLTIFEDEPVDNIYVYSL